MRSAALKSGTSYQRIRRVLAAASLLISLPLASGVAQTSAIDIEEGKLIAVIYPPWRDQGANIASVAAVGPVLGVGARSFVVFTRATDRRQRSALRADGAWIIADAAAFRWCGDGNRDIMI